MQISKVLENKFDRNVTALKGGKLPIYELD